MTMTDSAPVAVAETAPGPRPAGVAGVVTANDCRTVGRSFMAVSLAFAVAAAVIGVLTRLERIDPAAPDQVLGGLNSWFQMWTLYRAALVLLVVMPLFLGLAMAVVPSKLGAAGLAFPRAAQASFWSWLIGSLIVAVSVFAGGGWGALDGVTGAERDAMALTLLGTGLVIASLLAGAVNLAATVISLRPAGMSLLEVPLFAWSMLVSAAVWLFTLPVAVANIVVVYADLRGRDPIAFGAPESPDIWRQLDWLVEQPAVYALAVPVLGIAAEVVADRLGVPLERRGAVVALVGLFGLLAVGGWSQDYFTAPADHRDELLYVAAGLAVVVVVVAFCGGIAASARRGLDRLGGLPDSALAGAALALVLLAGAAASGGLRVIEPFDLLERSTAAGVFNAVVAVALIGAAAGAWHWAPEILGRPLSESRGRVAVVLLAAGGALLAAPDVLSGFLGAADMPFVGRYDSGAVGGLNAVAAAGAVLLALGLIAAVAAVVEAMRAGPSADAAAAGAGADAGDSASAGAGDGDAAVSAGAGVGSSGGAGS